MAKYVAPDHVTSVFLSCGEYAVVDGVAELPDDLSYGDAIGLAANGFVESDNRVSMELPKRVSTKPVPSDAAGGVEGLDMNGKGSVMSASGEDA